MEIFTMLAEKTGPKLEQYPTLGTCLMPNNLANLTEDELPSLFLPIWLNENCKSS